MTVRAADPAPTISVASPVPPDRPRSRGLKPPCQPRPVILGSVIFPLHVGVVRYPEGHRVRVLYLRGSSVWHVRGSSVWHVRVRRSGGPVDEGGQPASMPDADDAEDGPVRGDTEVGGMVKRAVRRVPGQHDHQGGVGRRGPEPDVVQGDHRSVRLWGPPRDPGWPVSSQAGRPVPAGLATDRAPSVAIWARVIANVAVIEAGARPRPPPPPRP